MPNLLDVLQSFPQVKVIIHDEQKTICSVRMTVERTEKINSGSMQFHHPRYLTFGQMVVFTNAETESDQSGALFFRICDADEAARIINTLDEQIIREKEKPDNSIIIEQET